MKIGVVDVGGGLHDIYGLGILDWCMDAGIQFDVCVGVSAGSANIAAYMAGQRKRNYPFYTEYPFRKEYMSIGNYLKKGCFLDLNYVYSVLSNSDGENPLDYETMANYPGDLFVVGTNAKTGKPAYFTKTDISQDQYGVFKSSSAIPVFCKPYETSGITCYDGALSDPVPVAKALEEGCDKIVLILTKPKAVPRTPGNDPKFAALIKLRYPESAKALKNRYLLYNSQVEEAKKLEAEGRVCILAPDNLEGMTTLKKDVKAMEKLYNKGYHDAESRLPAFFGTADGNQIKNDSVRCLGKNH